MLILLRISLTSFTPAEMLPHSSELQLNANMLRVWIKRAASALPEAARATERSSLPLSGTGFLPVPLGGGAALPGSPTERSIRLQIRRGATSRIRTPA